MSYNSLEDTGNAGIDERALKRRGDDSWRKMEGLPNGNGDNNNVGEHEEEPLNTRQRSSNRCAAVIGLRRVFPSHAETNFLPLFSSTFFLHLTLIGRSRVRPTTVISP